MTNLVKARFIHLGFEIGGDAGHRSPVMIPIKHMAVTGQTQESGKTTALEALISRSGCSAIAFLTKRGEHNFAGAERVPPFFRERSDWQFVESILESTMKQRMKFERAWIVKACKGAQTLADVQRNISDLQARSKRSMDQDLYMLLGEYLARVVPEIRRLPKLDRVEIFAGEFTVVDLVDYPDELQMLVISSTLEWIHRNTNDVLVIIPEAWKFIPQGRNTPVKISAEKLAREGAALRNFIWIDSQDMAAVDKLILRACAVWLIGVQREANEIKRALSNMPAGLKKPKASDVATLQLGQFFACFGSEIRKTYVQPAWMDDKAATNIASGRLSVHDPAAMEQRPGYVRYEVKIGASQHSTREKEPAAPTWKPGAAVPRVTGEFPSGSPQDPGRGADSPALQTSAKSEVKMSFTELQLIEVLERALRHANDRQPEDALATLRRGIPANLLMSAEKTAAPASATNGRSREYSAEESLDNEALYQAIKGRLLQEAPGLIVSLTRQVTEIEVQEIREKISMDTRTLDGRIAFLIAEGFFNQRRGNKDTIEELAERGWPALAPNVSRSFGKMVELGFLRQESNGQYKAVDGMKVNIVAA